VHELGITKRILDIALHAAQERGASRITAIRLKIGEFTSIDPSCIEFYFSAIAPGTAAEGAKIVVDRVPLEARCKACGAPFVPANLTFRCPGCEAPDVEITSGREIYVDAIEVEGYGNQGS